jgi:hypothetical protein
MTYEEIEKEALALDSDSQQRLRSALTISLEIYPLAYFSNEDVLEWATEEFVENDALKEACSAAAYRVWTKWSGSSDLESAAQDWAMDIVRDSAIAAGLTAIQS